MTVATDDRAVLSPDASHLRSSITAKATGPVIVPYRPDRKREIAGLLNQGLGPKLAGQRDAEYWSWKHERNPFGPSLVLLAEADGRLVGVRAFMRWQLALDGQGVEAAKPVDTVTHPDYQGRGIFRQLTTEACEVARQMGVRLLFNTPNANSLPGYLKLGWRRVAELPLFVKLLRPAVAFWHVTRWRFRPGGVPGPETFFRDTAQAAPSVLERAEAEIRELLAEPHAPGTLSTKRTVDFLHWRYARHPHIRYFAETIERGGRLDGVVFYRTNFRAGLREIMIDEVLVRRSETAIAPELLQNLRKHVRADYLVAHAALGSPGLAMLRAAGFRRLPRRRITLVAKPLGDRLTVDVGDPSTWALGLGDIEGL